MVQTRGREYSPRSPTGTEHGLGWERGSRCATRRRSGAPPFQAAGTEHFSLDVEDVPAGWRPDSLAGVRPQERIQRRTVEQTVDAPLLLTLDSPAPLMVEQLVDVLQFVDALVPVAEQVIEVPKIILEDIPVRTLVREPQLVEVPTILTPFIRMLQNVDTLVPRGGRGASGGLQVFLPGQYSSFTVKQIVDSPVSRGGGRRLQGSLPERSATALTVEQNVDKSFPGESLQDVRRGQDSASSSHSPAGVADDAFEGFFALFTRLKQMRHCLRTLGRHCLGTRAHGRRQLMTCRWRSRRRRSPRRSLTMTSSFWSLMGAGGAASGSRLASSVASGWPRQTGPGWPYYLAAPVAHRQFVRVGVVLTGDDTGAATFSRWCSLHAGAALRQPVVALEEFPLLRRFARAVRTGKAGHFSFALVSFCPGPVFGRCLWRTAFWIFRDPACSPLGSTEALDEFFTLSILWFTRILRRFAFIHAEWRACTVDANGCSCSQRCSHFDAGHYF